MREIVFRGKRVKSGKFVEGYVFKQYVQPKGEEWYIRAYETDYCVITETIGQYIGGVDKNGKMVFEGDIVKFKGELYVVKYIDKYNRFAGVKPRTVFAVFNFSMAEIVGNIYDNPEMMKGDSLQ